MNFAIPCLTDTSINLQASYQVAINENPANQRSTAAARKKRAAGNHAHFWAPGRTLRIAFVSGDQAFKDAVIAAASAWQPHINLSLAFVEGSAGEIRISSTPGVYWSAIGTNALLIEEGPTMHLSPDLHAPAIFAASVLHEFGHALGAEHEHLHPESNIPWNKAAVYAAHGVAADADEDDYARRAVDERYFNLLDASQFDYSPYDPQSIMHYPVRQDWTLGDFRIDLNRVLSEKDKAFMAKAYPHPVAQSA
jgi:hypothetical protein